MPAVAPPPAKHDAEVRSRLDQAARRIRTHDMLFGVALMAVVVFAYLATVVVLDHAVELPAWTRQLGFVGLLGVLGWVGYRWVGRPLRQVVNPLYAARQVEQSVPDAKNGIINWVDLKDRELPDSVRAAVGQRAAKQLRDADMETAGDPKRLVWGGAAVLGLTVVLAVLFLVYRPSVFLSLTGRALNPFAGTGIATRTQLTLTEPAAGDLTVTAGQPVVIAVTVGGRVPDADAPDRLRVKLRHNPASPEFEEVPLEQAGTARDWQIKLPEHLILSGFWYTVAGGDAETAEHRVVVRPKPQFTAFDVRYEYPAYLRMPAASGDSADLEAYRGTTVTVTAKANRELKDGRANLPGKVVPGEVVGDARDTLRVSFKLTDPGEYKLHFRTPGGEQNLDGQRYAIRILADQPPTLAVKLTEKEEKDGVTVPANGLLKVDASAGDDFGLDTLSLRLRVLDKGQGLQLADKPYQGGQSFLRKEDNTFPTAVEYKDSVPLAEVKTADGQPFAVKEGMVLEATLEARDNCTEPAANVGRKAFRVVVGPPLADPKKPADDRKKQEAAHQQQQAKKLQQEKRPENVPPQQQRDPGDKTEKADGQQQQPGDPMQGTETKPDPNGQKQPGNDPAAKPMGTDPAAKPMPGDQQPMPGDATQADPKQPPMPGDPKQPKKPDDPGPPPGAREPNPADPKQPPKPVEANAQPMPGDAKQSPMPGDPKQPPTGDGQPMNGGPSPEEQRKLDQEAKRVQDAAREQQQQELRQAQKDLTDPDPQKQQDARNKLDEAVGPEQRQRMEQLQKDLKSDDPQTRRKAEEQLSQLQREFDKGGEADTRPPQQPQDQADYLSRELNKAANDMRSNDPQQQKAGQDRMDELVGKENRPQAEQMNKDRQDQDELQKKKAEEQFDELRKKAEQKQQADMQKAAHDMASDDPKRQEAGRQQMDKMIGKENREKAEQQAKELANDLNSPDPDKKRAAEQKLDQMRQQGNQRQEAGQPQGGGEQKPSDQQMKDLEQAAKDLAGNDEAKKQEAREKLDRMVGKENRLKAEQEAKQLSDDLNSNDPEKQKAAQQKLDQMREKLQWEAGKNQGTEKKKPNDADTLTREQMQQAAQDLASGDKQKQEQARQKLDQSIGQPKREQLEKQAEKLNQDLQSKDAATKDAAEQQLDELRKKEPPPMGGQAGKSDAQKQKEIEQAAQDMASGDPKQQEAGRKKMDELIGEQNRKRAEQEAKQLAQDLQSPDEKTRKQAEQKLDDFRKQMEQAQKANGQQPDPKQAEQAKKDMDQIAKDVQSGDKQKQQDAQQKLNEQIQKQAQQEAKQLMDDLQSKDEKTRQAAQQKLDDLKKQMEQLAKESRRQPSPEQIEQLKKAAQDLNSKDDQTRKQAEDNLDKELGKPAREQMQAEMQKKATESADEQAKAAENVAKKAADDRARRSAGGDSGGAPDKAMDVNQKFAKRAADLALESKRTLDKLKEKQQDAEFLKKLGYTPEEYERFLKGYEQRSEQLAKEAETAAKGPPPTKPGETQVPQRRVDGAGRVEARKDGTAAGPNGGGPTVAPPGYGDAQRRFNQGAGDKR